MGTTLKERVVQDLDLERWDADVEISFTSASYAIPRPDRRRCTALRWNEKCPSTDD